MARVQKIARPRPLPPPHFYTLHDLQDVFGVSRAKVESWLGRGLLGRPLQRGGEVFVAERNVARFLNESFTEYDLRKMDQICFKHIAFYGGLEQAKGKRR
jgi:hypothetical protein